MVLLEGRHSRALKLEVNAAAMSKASILLLLTSVTTQLARCAEAGQSVATYEGSLSMSERTAELSERLLVWVPLLLLWVVSTIAFCAGVVVGRRSATVAKPAQRKSLTAAREEEPPLPERLYVATNCGERWHVDSRCSGLSGSRSAKSFTACAVCAPSRVPSKRRGAGALASAD